ncbi:MAG: hypothetical protein LUB59_02780 [Candidatus Gastranaerophilales bacterium]|nr:hypothetical protein [Candidatus Gastranaerophilales bacterium]
MKKYLVSAILIIVMFNYNLATASGIPADFTGENFFRAPMQDMTQKETQKTEEDSGSIPPIKLLRLKYREYCATSDARKDAKEKRKAVKKALRDYKKNKDLRDAQTIDVPTDKDIEHLEMGGVEESKSPQRVVIACDDMDYSTETGILNANGNVRVNFVLEETLLKTDHLVYDKKSNHISAIGNVIVSKKGVDVYGESINVDMNEENALIDKPLSKLSKISISAERGYVYPNKVIQEKGTVKVDSSYPIHLEPHGKSPKLKKMMVGLDDKSTLDDFVGSNSVYRIKVSNIIINSDKKLESMELRKARIYKGDRKIFTLPWIKLYTNKKHDFVDGDFPELGSRRNLGMFIGPGWAIKMPFGSLLKIAPIATYRNKFGVGGFARFLSGTNTTELAYGTSQSKFVLRGEQALDDNLRLEYASYDYMDNWFLGRRRPKYGVSLIYEQSYNHKNFFAPNMDMKYTHQASFGLFEDPKNDTYYKRLHGNETSTVRGRYMAEIDQKLFSFKNEDELINASISVVGQGSAALYGSGETQFIGRIGPRLHTQYKRWMQDVGYFQTAYQDDTPMPVFDAYRYGHSNIYVREYIRLHRFLTLSWLGSLTLSDDRWNSNEFQECAFFVSIGPDDLKINFGYDVIRENAYINFSLGLDPKGTVIDYDRLEIKNPENFKVEPKKTFYAGNTKPVDTTPKILQQAVVEEIFDSSEEDEEL